MIRIANCRVLSMIKLNLPYWNSRWKIYPIDGYAVPETIRVEVDSTRHVDEFGSAWKHSFLMILWKYLGNNAWQGCFHAWFHRFAFKSDLVIVGGGHKESDAKFLTAPPCKWFQHQKIKLHRPFVERSVWIVYELLSRVQMGGMRLYEPAW